ncbi:MAG: hypothetical protein A3G32_05285 [Deltaproteobacteria bacterium RIFCSPLOWO2_12_FULL_40_28]|nr:MAG: hypothetical protein A3C45_09395 [Deltaproteobacteria bacterium RIFCSPHIGHO2_02_FULL_40_28]OGQ19774.1 MAG: hypothetical protein A3E27_08590 [Deltaproteobacteria bacterium RIFCSPHIGHO2_12_FULL_40_32]OGQ41051.1 MAG: hypothetical protein A3I69_04005 [Deltaproteobacteria bacterium RIFCSPLOWO2_02_FULL_40_36]OGQ54167.1 MAG: hypothetical protein A3G32_05285 [Deltaproteobacteria bacterium RIFCSPLOWO2_12_FULL_40_28]
MLYLVLNLAFIGIAVAFFFNKKLLNYSRGGHFWLTWLAIGVITLMDELTSLFYAPSEAHRYLGPIALVFIPITALVIHYMTTRMVEIAYILDNNKLKGGGVYNFSYLVLGPLVSFIAVASIMVDYMLTGAISAVSAIENLTSFHNLFPFTKIILQIAMIWLVAGLNILGIRQNVKVTFGIFLVTLLILLNLIIGGLFQFDSSNLTTISNAISFTAENFNRSNWAQDFQFVIIGLSSCILAYSGVESVLQTAGFAENWKIIKKAYIFLALSVGILIPVIAVLVLSSPNIDFQAHETDLITHYATIIHGPWFGMSMAVAASVTLLMAVNTAYVASSELIERVSHRYGFRWLIQTNNKASLYRIHIMSALAFSAIIVFTQGQQMMLAEMYAIGLLASFSINLLCLLIYRYSKGTSEIREFSVSRIGTFLFFILITGCFVYISYHKPAGFLLWLSVTVACFIIGFLGTRERAPEIKEISRGETAMEIVLHIAEKQENNIHLYFKRPHDTPQEKIYGLSLFITFYSPRQHIPPRLSPDHFRLPFKRTGVFNNIEALLDLLNYEMPDKNITIHFGWPTSSWLDRLAIGVMTFQFIRLPKLFPTMNFRIDYFKSVKK